MTDRTVLLCVPKETPDALVITDSTTGWCELCATEIWIAPSGQEIQEDGAMVVCIDCGVGMIATDKEPNIQAPTDKQLDELRRHRDAQ